MDNMIIDGQQISQVKETKFLAMNIDNNLKLSAHIQYTRRKHSKGIGILFKDRKDDEQNTSLLSYNSLMLPYLNYCIHVWGKITIPILTIW